MAEMKDYVAIADFSLNFDNGAKSINVHVGDELSFDGLYAKCRGESGQSRSLSKIVGEWIREKSNSQTLVRAPRNTLAQAASRNATGGKIVEDSDASRDLGVRAQQEDSHSELKRLVNQYENTPAPTRKIQDDDSDMRKESRVQVENQDAQEVAKVSSAANTNAQKNITGPTVEEPQKKKSSVISHEEKVVKSTKYSKKAAESDEPKRLKVDPEASGKEVRKVTVPETLKKGVNTFGMGDKNKVSVENEEVVQMNYPPEQATIVGSSTQPQLERAKVMEKPVVMTGASVVDEQDGVVVRKVSKIAEDNMTTQEGIISKVTVGAGGDMEVGDVVFESNSDIIEGKATFSKTGDTVVDIGSGEDSDIDINGILENM